MPRSLGHSVPAVCPVSNSGHGDARDSRDGDRCIAISAISKPKRISSPGHRDPWVWTAGRAPVVLGADCAVRGIAIGADLSSTLPPDYPEHHQTTGGCPGHRDPSGTQSPDYPEHARFIDKLMCATDCVGHIRRKQSRAHPSKTDNPQKGYNSLKNSRFHI